MRAPAFWRQPTLFAGSLIPFSWVYWAIARYRQASMQKWTSPVPVICVGNVVAGGAGKTPLVLLLAGYFQKQGIKAFVVSRGYKGSLSGPILVEHALHTAAEVGDEPMLIAGHATCIVAKDRNAGIRAAAGAEVIILDDGLQTISVASPFSLLVIDGEYGLGNGYIIPAGPLRETLADALARVQAVVIIGEDKQGIKEKIGSAVPVYSAILQPAHPEHYAGKHYMAFAGIGRPEKFFATLRATGAVVKDANSFADHHVFSEAELTRLAEKAALVQATLITTEKDFFRLPPAWQKRVEVLPVTLAVEEKESFEKLLASIAPNIRMPA